MRAWVAVCVPLVVLTAHAAPSPPTSQRTLSVALTLYRDGVQVAAPGTMTPVQNNTAVTIGGGVGTTNWTGALDEARFYSRVLSAEEIAAIAASTVN